MASTPAHEQGGIEHRFEDAGVRLHVAAIGRGRFSATGRSNAHPLVLLHGFPESWRAWEHLLPAFAEAGVRAHAPDLPGYGDSERPRGLDAYRLSALAGVVARLLERIGGGAPVPLAGHDWGGIVAMATAAWHPELVAHLIALNAPHLDVMRRTLARSPAQLARSAYAGFFQLPHLAERVVALPWTIPTALRRSSVAEDAFSDELLATYAAQARAPGAATAMLSYYRATVRRPERLPLVRVPTTVIWGERDRFLGEELWRGMERVIGDVRFVRMRGASHWLHHERPADVTRAIVRAIEPVAASSARGDVVAVDAGAPSIDALVPRDGRVHLVARRARTSEALAWAARSPARVASILLCDPIGTARDLGPLTMPATILVTPSGSASDAFALSERWRHAELRLVQSAPNGLDAVVAEETERLVARA